MTTATRPVRTSIRGAEHFIRDRKNFHAGNLRGEWTDRVWEKGRLPIEQRDELIEATHFAREDGHETYVVFSYATPIAWTTPTGELYVPDVSYSVSTSRHQGVCRRAA